MSDHPFWEIYYRLEGPFHVAVQCRSKEEFYDAWEVPDRRVARTAIGEVIVVSTVFLVLDHSWGKGDPLLFETMIFDGNNEDYQTRCSTWAEAEQMHEVAVAHATALYAAANIDKTFAALVLKGETHE